MRPQVRVRHFLKDTDISTSEQATVLTVAKALKRLPSEKKGFLTGSSIGLLFEKPSLRTRVSSETAASLLGAFPVTLRGEELHFHRGEEPEDAARVLSGYLSLLLARVYKHSLLTSLAEPSALPIVNGLCDSFHPLQALADLLTISESFNGRLEGLHLTYLGDGNNVAHSLLLAGAMAGLHVAVASPEGYAPNQDIVEEAKTIATKRRGSITIAHDPKQFISHTDVIYTDVWVSMGDEAEHDLRNDIFAPYQLNEALISLAHRDTIVLHCLPAHFGLEITRGVFHSNRSRIINQAHNRLPTTAAIFLMLLDYENFIRLGAEQ